MSRTAETPVTTAPVTLGESPPPSARPERRRFTVAVLIGQLVVAVPYMWILFCSWGPFRLDRPVFEDQIYDLQAKSLLHGHLYVPNGSLGIEGFLHGGHEYTYFGLFPSILRMPFLLLSYSLYEKFTPLLMLVAWVLTGVFASLLLWRMRVLVRGTVALGRAEAVSYGALIAAVTGGSVLVYLAETPYVFDEDLAWSVALTVVAVFILLGMLEKPSRMRVVGAGVVITAANLNRTTTGYVCVVAAILVSWWFWSGRGGPENRKWFMATLMAGVIGFAIGGLVNTLKFGSPIGLPVADQVYSMVNAHRKLFLKVNHNVEYGPQFAPADLLAYLRPDGLKFTNVFPFVTLPGSPAPSAFGVVYDLRYRTTSILDSMPLLFLLSCWGAFAAFRRKRSPGAVFARIFIISSALSAVAILLWGYIADRYLADFLPLLIVASIFGLVDIWHRTGHGRGRSRTLLCSVVLLGAFISIVVNLGIAATPTTLFQPGQAAAYLNAQLSVSDVTGHPIHSLVHHVDALPPRVPEGQIDIVGNCDGLFVSNGEDFSTVPRQQYGRQSWLLAEFGPTFKHTFRITVERPPTRASFSVPLVVAGPSVIGLKTVRLANPSEVELSFTLQDPRFGSSAKPASLVVPVGSSGTVTVNANSAQHIASVYFGNNLALASPMLGSLHVTTQFPRGRPDAVGGVQVVNTSAARASALCRRLLATTTTPAP